MTPSNDNGEKETVRRINKTFGGVLSKMFFKIMIDNQITQGDFDRILDNYFTEKARSEIGSPVRAYEKSNWRRAFFESEMTWDNFGRVFMVLKRPKFKFTIEIEHPNGKTTTHTLPVDINNIGLLDGGVDILDQIAEQIKNRKKDG